MNNTNKFLEVSKLFATVQSAVEKLRVNIASNYRLLFFKWLELQNFILGISFHLPTMSH